MAGRRMAEFLIAGIGSPHGADRLGWALCAALLERSPAVDVRVEACATPMELTALLARPWRRVLVVDALLGPGPVGAVRSFVPGALPSEGRRLLAHGGSLPQALDLALALGADGSAIEVLTLDVGDALAPIQMAWIEHLLAAVLQRLEDWRNFAISAN